MSTESVTVAIRRRVDPARIPEATAWVQAGVNLAGGYPGFLGSGWVRESAHSTTWHMLYRFADEETLLAWEHSDARTDWLRQASDFVHDDRVERRTGIEGWFDAPTPTRGIEVAEGPPPRWKQAVGIWLGFFPANLAFTAVATAFAPGWDEWGVLFRVLATTVVLTPLMVFWVLPFVTRALHDWLHARR